MWWMPKQNEFNKGQTSRLYKTLKIHNNFETLNLFQILAKYKKKQINLYTSNVFIKKPPKLHRRRGSFVFRGSGAPSL